MKKCGIAIALTGIIAISNLTTAFAGSWKQDNIGRWYENDDGSYTQNGWQWIDGNNDGTSECYYFDPSGYCLMDTITPDGSVVDGNGAWTLNGVIQTQAAENAVFVPDAQSTVSISSPESIWAGNYPYVSGMISEKPDSGTYWTVNISTGKYHGTSSVEGLLPENTRYYAGDSSALDDRGYSRCKKGGCY